MEIHKKYAHHFYNITVIGTTHTSRTALATYFYDGYQDRILNGFLDIEIFLADPPGILFNTAIAQNMATLPSQGQDLIRQTLRDALQLTVANEIQITETVIALNIEFYHDGRLIDNIFQRNRIGFGFSLYRYSNNDRQEQLTATQATEYIQRVRQELQEQI